MVKHEHGRPQLKPLQRKQPVLASKVNSPINKRMLKAAAFSKKRHATQHTTLSNKNPNLAILYTVSKLLITSTKFSVLSYAILTLLILAFFSNLIINNH